MHSNKFDSYNLLKRVKKIINYTNVYLIKNIDSISLGQVFDNDSYYVAIDILLPEAKVCSVDVVICKRRLIKFYVCIIGRKYEDAATPSNILCVYGRESIWVCYWFILSSYEHLPRVCMRPIYVVDISNRSITSGVVIQNNIALLNL